MKIILFVEGESDSHGLQNLLRNEISLLRKNRHSLRIYSFMGKFNLLRKIGYQTRRAIEEVNADIVFALVDLYPGDIDPDALRRKLRSRAPREYRDRFHPHVAVHDLEAWILADPEPLRRMLKARSIRIYPNPERVDNQKPPKRHLEELFRRHLKRAYRATEDGPRLFAMIDSTVVANKCPNFKMLRDDLLRLLI